MSPAPRKAYAGVSEAEFQEQVFTLAHYNRWKVAHFRPAQTRSGAWITPVGGDGKGWPDCFFVHPATGDVLAVELKKEYNSPVTPEQAEWLAWLELAGIEVDVWRPSHIDRIITRLRKPRG